jgi:hypothetical protein
MVEDVLVVELQTSCLILRAPVKSVLPGGVCKYCNGGTVELIERLRGDLCGSKNETAVLPIDPHQSKRIGDWLPEFRVFLNQSQPTNLKTLH